MWERVNERFDKSSNEHVIRTHAWSSLMRSTLCARVEQLTTVVPRRGWSINCWPKWMVSIRRMPPSEFMSWQRRIEWVCQEAFAGTKLHLSVIDILDPAILRPGRLDKHIYVGLPNAQGRLDILQTITKVNASRCGWRWNGEDRNSF